MESPQDTSNHAHLGRRRYISVDGAETSRGSSPARVETGQLVGDDTQTNEAAWEVYSVLEEPPQREAPSAPLQAEGRPPTEAKWNFNLESDTPGTLLPLPPVAADLRILERLPTEELTIFPEALFRGMEKCIKGHRQDMVG